MDVSRAMSWLEVENQRRPVTERILLAALLLEATALAARSFKEMNGYHVEGMFHPEERVHVGVDMRKPPMGGARTGRECVPPKIWLRRVQPACVPSSLLSYGTAEIVNGGRARKSRVWRRSASRSRYFW